MAETRPKGVTHGTWNKNPGNIKGYRKGGEKNDFTKWLDEKGIEYSKGTKAGDGGWFLKFENNADGLIAATNFWDVVKNWGTYKNEEGVSLSVRDALGVYAADGYDNVFLKNLEDKGIDLDAKLDSLSADSLATISHHQMQTEDPNQYSELKKNGLITENDTVNYDNSELKKYQPKVLSSSEQLESQAQEAKDLIAKYKSYQNTKVTLDKDLKKDILSEIDKFSQEFANKSPKGWVGSRSAVPEMKKEYMTGINAILKDKTKDIDASTPEGYNLLGEYNHLAYMHVANEDYGIQMGGNRLVDTNFEVMTEELRVGGQEFNALPRRYSVPQSIKDEVGNNEFIQDLNAKEQKTTGSQAIGLSKRKPDLLSTEYNDEERNAIIDEHVRRQVNPTEAEKLVDKIEEATEKVEDYNDNSTEEKRQRSGKKEVKATEGESEEIETSEEDVDLGLITDTTDVEKAVYDADGNAYDPDAPNFSGKGLVSKDDYNSWVDFKQSNPDSKTTFEEFQDYSKNLPKDEATEPTEGEVKVEGTEGDTTVTGEGTEEVEKKEGLGSKLLSGLKANAGTVVSGLVGAWSLSKAMEEVDAPKLDGLSAGFRANLHEAREMAKKGFTPSEQANFRAKVDKAYNTGIENVVRGSAGNRARFLAGTGILDANKNSALLDFAAKDSEIRRQNQGRYDALLNFSETFESQKDEKEKLMSYEAKLKTKSAAAGLASSALGQAIKGMNSSGEDEYYSMLIQQFKDGQKKTNSEYSGIPESTSDGIKPQYAESSTAPPAEATNVEIKDINIPNSFTTPEIEEWTEGQDEYAK